MTNNTRKQMLPLALVLMLGAGLGTASVEVSKRLGLGPFGAQAVAATNAAPASHPSAGTLHAASLQAAPLGCGCGVQAARRSLFQPVRVARLGSTGHAAAKPAGDCMLANVDAQPDPIEALVQIDATSRTRKLTDAVAIEADLEDPAMVNLAAAPVMASAQYAAAPLFSYALGGQSSGGSAFGRGAELVSSMAAGESFGAPIVFAATSNPDTGSNPGPGSSGGGATSVVEETPTVPEPSPLALFALGMLCLLASRGRQLAARVSR